MREPRMVLLMALEKGDALEFRFASKDPRVYNKCVFPLEKLHGMTAVQLGDFLQAEFKKLQDGAVEYVASPQYAVDRSKPDPNGLAALVEKAGLLDEKS